MFKARLKFMFSKGNTCCSAHEGRKSVAQQNPWRNPWQKPTTRNKIRDKKTRYTQQNPWQKTRYTQQNPWHNKTRDTDASKSMTKTIYTQQNTWHNKIRDKIRDTDASKSVTKTIYTQQNPRWNKQNPRFESHLGYTPLDIYSPFHFYLRRIVNGAGTKGICCDDKFSMCFCIRNRLIRNCPRPEN